MLVAGLRTGTWPVMPHIPEAGFHHCARQARPLFLSKKCAVLMLALVLQNPASGCGVAAVSAALVPCLVCAGSRRTAGPAICRAILLRKQQRDPTATSCKQGGRMQRRRQSQGATGSSQSAHGTKGQPGCYLAMGTHPQCRHARFLACEFCQLASVGSHGEADLGCSSDNCSN